MAEENDSILHRIPFSGKFSDIANWLNENFHLIELAIKQNTGKSAYEVWRDYTDGQGNQPNIDKTEEEFLASLKESGYKMQAVTARPSTIAGIEADTIYMYPDGTGQFSTAIYTGDLNSTYDSTKWIVLATNPGDLSGAFSDIEGIKENIRKTPSMVSNMGRNHVFVSTNDNPDVINVCDAKGNIAISVRNGHLYTKNANTEVLGSFKENGNGEFTVSDARGNVAFKVSENGVSLKKGIVDELILGGNNILEMITSLSRDTLKFINTDEGDIIRLIDKHGYILAIISENGITTRNSASSDIDITVANSDTITIIGSSLGETEGYGTTIFPANKHWSGIISMYLDYRIQNLSVSGSNKITALYKIRKGDWKPIGRYCLVANDENVQFDSRQHTMALDNLCKCLLSIGIEPIICTSYHKDWCLSSAYKNYAKEHNYMMLDAAHYCNSLRSGIVEEFDDGAHLRRRNIPMVADAYMPQLMMMENPLQSVKVFRVRDASFNDLDELVFTSNFERAKIFREITVSSSANIDEYCKLAGGSSISFNKVALISCILPAIGKNANNVRLSFVTNDDNIAVYAKNDMISPYPNPTNATRARFSIEDEIDVPSVGSVYTVEGSDYTVTDIIIGENNYYCTVYCTPSTLPSTLEDGNMTKKSGDGDEQIYYALAEQATVSVMQFVENDNNGHYVALTKSNGYYRLPDEDGYIDYDKVNFLIVSSGTFSLSDIHVMLSASSKKQRKDRMLFEWTDNDELPTDELLPETKFGNVGTSTSYWRNDSNSPLMSQSSYGEKYPSGCSSLVRISDVVAMNYTAPSSSLAKNGKMWLEVWCRYFPTAPSPYTQAGDTVIDDSSYDYSTLYVQFGEMNKKAVVENEVGLMWKIVRVPITLYYNASTPSMPIRLSASKELEICKVSLKYEC